MENRIWGRMEEQIWDHRESQIWDHTGAAIWDPKEDTIWAQIEVQIWDHSMAQARMVKVHTVVHKEVLTVINAVRECGDGQVSLVKVMKALKDFKVLVIVWRTKMGP